LRTDEELLEELRRVWEYPEHSKLVVIGKIEQISTREGRAFNVVNEIRNPYNGTFLKYPESTQKTHHTIYLGNIPNKLINEGVREGSWILFEAELAPQEERRKRDNLYELNVIANTASPLSEIPKGISQAFASDSGDFVEEWVIDALRKSHEENVLREVNQKKTDLEAENELHLQSIEQLGVEKKQIEESIAWLNNRLENTKSDSEDLQKQLEQLRTSKELEVVSYDREIIKRENKLLKLNRFIEQKTELLTKLELLDLPEEGLAATSPSERAGHEFSEVFGSDVNAAVAYIQVYLKEKGIYYSRNVLETFYALLMSNDLIILAGDSGSGKTNLVKSFADAIGGKSVIVPVKPNWTSSEDLIGYYNPLEKKYLSTQFLDAIIEASKHPEIPYLICLDEMNLARVEYYFADFLSLLEERESQPELRLYSEAESAHLVSECRMFLSLVDEATSNSESINSFVDILKNEELNEKLHKLCGFQDGSSLLKYHSQLRKNLGSYLSTPSSLVIPPNVRFIGAINVDETTHYLSPKILDRAHIIKFSSSLLSKWDDIEAEFEDTELDINLPVILSPAELNFRTSYPRFDREDKLVKSLLFIAEEYLEPLGIEFGLRSVRQAREFAKHAEKFEASYEQILNSLVLHKILPKMMFDGEKELDEDYAKKELLSEFRDYLGSELDSLRNLKGIDYSVAELDRVIANAKANDWVVNYWPR
tara:strand:- start:24563 stop:26686 length:2124 start_codon:yes stop_codon:yes gene_type:complete